MKKTSHMIHTETKHVLITDESWPYKTLVHKVLPVCICDWRKLVIGLWVLQLKCISCLWFQISFELCTLPIWNHLPDYSLSCNPSSPITNRAEQLTSFCLWLPHMVIQVHTLAGAVCCCSVGDLILLFFSPMEDCRAACTPAGSICQAKK